MTETLNQEMSRTERRRFILRGVTRALILSLVLILLYFLGPLDRVDAVPVWVVLVLAPLILLAVSAWQIRAILRSDQPGLRGIEALSIVAPLYLILFAATYFLMARADAASFTVEGLTRIDTLYFTTTVFSTVGFGDISPASEAARVVAMIQMILNLVVLGAGVKLLTAAVQRGRASKAAEEPSAPRNPESGMRRQDGMTSGDGGI
jgi:voltage-gated potassium channel